MQNSCIFAREDLYGSYAGYEHFQRQNKEKVKNPGECCAHHTSSEQHSDHGRIINLQRDRVLSTRSSSRSQFLQLLLWIIAPAWTHAGMQTGSLSRQPPALRAMV